MSQHEATISTITITIKTIHGNPSICPPILLFPLMCRQRDAQDGRFHTPWRRSDHQALPNTTPRPSDAPACVLSRSRGIRRPRSRQHDQQASQRLNDCLTRVRSSEALADHVLLPLAQSSRPVIGRKDRETRYNIFQLTMQMVGGLLAAEHPDAYYASSHHAAATTNCGSPDLGDLLVKLVTVRC